MDKASRLIKNKSKNNFKHYASVTYTFEFVGYYQIYREDLADSEEGYTDDGTFPYMEEVQKAINKEWEDLSKYINDDLTDIVESIETPRIINNGKVFIDVKYKTNPTKEQIEETNEYLIGQMYDGWGESFEQRPIYVPYNTEIYISFRKA